MFNLQKNSLWQWQTWEGLPYLTCSLLSQWQHGFFTQHFSPRTPENLVEILHPQAQAYRLKQVHSNQVLTPAEIAANRAQAEEVLPSGDGMISDSSLQALWVASADCTPVLIGDVTTGTVASLHSGWRGTAENITQEAVARFVAAGSCPENLRVALGPAIAGEVYQVSEEVAVQVGASILDGHKDDPELLTVLLEMPKSPLLPDELPGRVRLDVRKVIALQLEKLGIEEEQIAIAPHCTYQQKEHFFSYRRTQRKQVQWSGIVS
jgi:hypothetical protein